MFSNEQMYTSKQMCSDQMCSEQTFSSEQMCSRGGGGRRLRDDCVYLYKKDPLKKWFAQGLPGTARYIRKAPRLFLSPIKGLTGALLNPLGLSVYHKKSVYGSQFMITFALTWGSLRLTLNYLMMLLP